MRDNERAICLLPLLLIGAITVTTNASAQQGRRVISRTDLERFLPAAREGGVVRQTIDGGSDTVAQTDREISLAPNQLLLFADTTQQSVQQIHLEDRIRIIPGIRAIATDATATTTLVLRPVFEVMGRGLRYNGNTGDFEGQVFLGLEDSLQPTERHQLREAIPFQLTGTVDAIEPGEFEVDHTNLPFRSAFVRARPVRGEESLQLRVRTQLHPQGFNVPLPLERAALSIAGPEQVLGWGLEVATLTVGVPAEIAGTRDVRIQSSPRGTPEPTVVRELSPGEFREVRLRSTGLDSVRVTATATALQPAVITVDFTFPIWFLLFAIVGGGVGGLASAIMIRRSGRKASIPLYALGGVPAGIVVAVAYTVGVNITGWKFAADYGEALVFTTAALAGAGMGAVSAWWYS